MTKITLPEHLNLTLVGAPDLNLIGKEERRFLMTQPAAPVPAETFDLTPTWTRLLPAFIALLQNGSPEGQKVAREELERMGALADSVNTARQNIAALDRKVMLGGFQHGETYLSEKDVLSALGMAERNTGGQ